MGNIYIIPTPIGNLGDITYRSKETLEKVNKIFAEDTRVTKKLLIKYNIVNNLFPYHQHNEHNVVDLIIKEVIEKDMDIALVSDAGTPGISDPGFLLVNKARENKITVHCLPGATSIIPALVQSGFATDEFSFFGFLPHKKGRKLKLKNILGIYHTIILFESPHRLLKLLKEIKEEISDTRKISISREITKMYEENIKGTAEELILHFEKKKIKGEIVLLIDKTPKKKNARI